MEVAIASSAWQTQEVTQFFQYYKYFRIISLALVNVSDILSFIFAFERLQITAKKQNV